MKNLFTWSTFKRLNEADSSGIGDMIKGALGLSKSEVKGELTAPGSFSGDKKENLKAIMEAMRRHSITNPYTQKAILGVIGKESGFIPQSELSYSKTDNSRIRKIFGSRVKGLSDAQLSEAKKDDVKFFDLVYGPEAKEELGFETGNTSPGDGYKYRARGFNGITFKSNYERYQKLLNEMGKLEKKPDILGTPDLLNSDPDVAAEVAILFFLDAAQSPTMKSKYGTNDLNSFKDQETALEAIVNLNAGIGKDIKKDALNSLGLARKEADQFDLKVLTT